MASPIERLRSLPHAAIGHWPTPIVDMPLPGRPAILVKRDDLSGFGRGGAKARKIAYLLGYVQAHGYTDLVTVAGNVTNLAFDLTVACARFGIGLHLYIIDDPPAPREDRDKIFGALNGRVTLLGPSRSRAFQTTVLRHRQLRRAGRRPLWVLPGVSHPAGILGNACGFLEMADQLLRAGRRLPSTVFVTAATGTTLAGFLLAEQALRACGHDAIHIVGAQIYPGRTSFATRWLAHWAGLLAGAQIPIRRAIDISTEALSGGFGRFTPELSSLCERVFEQTHIELDPIFGGKTWSVMEKQLDLGRFEDLQVMYWHCGFTPEWRVLGRVVQGAAAP